MLGLGLLLKNRCGRGLLGMIALLASFQPMNHSAASDQQLRPRIYLANPLGFSEAGRAFIHDVILPALGKYGHVINPFDLVDAKKIAELKGMPAGEDRIRAWRIFNAEIGKLNQDHIDNSDIVFAVLDGTDVDSGTASEIGYAYARQKLIIGYRGDFRLSADNEGGIVNLQVEHFIRASGGTIIHELSELDQALSSTLPRQ
jgi:nucleoside 2-deoxyribosyltransferase